MLSAKAPPVPSGYLRLWVRSVEGPVLALDLPATDHRIVIGKDRDFLNLRLDPSGHETRDKRLVVDHQWTLFRLIRLTWLFALTAR